MDNRDIRFIYWLMFKLRARILSCIEIESNVYVVTIEGKEYKEPIKVNRGGTKKQEKRHHIYTIILRSPNEPRFTYTL